MKKKTKILIVDDDASFVDVASRVLKEENFSVQCTKNAEEAMKKIAKTDYNLIITDVILPGTDGLKLLEKIKARDSVTDVIFCTSYSGVESAVKALKTGAYDYMIKPVEEDALRFTVRRCLEQRKIYEENEELKKTVELVERCKNISTTFDREKIGKFAIDLLMKETEASSGFFMAYSCNKGNKLEDLSVKGIYKNKSKMLLEMFPKMLSRWKKSKGSLFPLEKDEISMIKAQYKTVLDGIVIKIQVKSVIKAFIVLLNNTKSGEFTPNRIKNANFIIREINLAFTNLAQYLGAKELAYIDDLTNLYNSRYLFHILDREIKRAKRFNTTLILLFIDLDNFKDINDNHGHLVGGRVLVEVGDVLKKSVREIDTIIRYGGDEYIIVLTEASIQSGRMVAERIRKGIEKNVFLEKDKLNIKLTTCIGVAAYPKHASTKKELIHFADMAMYMGKETTKNAVYMAAERLK
jgi:diguanylate cyclase (GGDEF)-like protein